MLVMGSRTWWLPRWLDHLPRRIQHQGGHPEPSSAPEPATAPALTGGAALEPGSA